MTDNGNEPHGHRGGRSAFHRMDSADERWFLARLDDFAGAPVGKDVADLAKECGGSPSKRTIVNWLLRTYHPSVDLARRVEDAWGRMGVSGALERSVRIREGFADLAAEAPVLTSDDNRIRSLIAEQLSGTDFAGSILREAAKVVPQIMLGDYTHPAGASEAMTEFVRVLSVSRDKLAEERFAAGRSNGAGGASTRYKADMGHLKGRLAQKDEQIKDMAGQRDFALNTIAGVAKFLKDRHGQ